MKSKSSFKFKFIFSLVFAFLVLATYLYININEDIGQGYLSFGCVCACCLLSLMFINFKSKNILISLALVLFVVADVFLVFVANFKSLDIYLWIYCAAQTVFAVYSLFLCKGAGLKVFNLAVRIAVSLLIFYILPNFVALTSFQMGFVIYLANALITLIVLAFCLKTQWLMFLAFLLFFVCNFFTWLSLGGANILGLSEKFIEFITKYDFYLYTFIPSLLLFSLHSVWFGRESSAKE